jgi:hypothetical protein
MIKKNLFNTSSLSIIAVAPIATIVSCGAKNKIQLKDLSQKSKDFFISNGIRNFENKNYLIFMGSTACANCRMLISGSTNYLVGGRQYDGSDKMIHGEGVMPISKEGALYKISNFLDEKSIDLRTIEAKAPQNEVLP